MGLNGRVALSGVLLVLATGCLTPPPLSTETTVTLDPTYANLPTKVVPFTQLLCFGDVLKPLAGEHQDCDYKVTTKNGPAAEVSLAVNPLDPLNLVGGAKDFTLGEDENCGKYNVWSGVYWSRDGGRTWGNDLLPGHPKDTRKTALSDYACGSDPVLAFGPEGNAYYTSLMYTDDPNDKPPHPILAPVSGGQGKSAIAVTRSRDGGETWDDPVLLATRTKGGLDKQWIATDLATGQIYVSYIDVAASTLFAQRSDDQGLTWSKPAPIVIGGALPEGPFLVQMGQIGVGPDNLVHFTYWGVREQNGLSGAYHKSSRDGGATWSEARLVAYFLPPADLGVVHKYRIIGSPSLAVDPIRGTLYVAVPSRDPADANILVATSKDVGETWSLPVQVNDDLVGPLNDQWMAAIAVGPDGVVHLTWLDYRDDPSGQSAHVYYSYSADSGKTWSPNRRLSEVPFDGTGGYHQTGSGTIGDYMGLVVSPYAVHPFWADTRYQRNDAFSAILLTGGPGTSAIK